MPENGIPLFPLKNQKMPKLAFLLQTIYNEDRKRRGTRKDADGDENIKNEKVSGTEPDDRKA